MRFYSLIFFLLSLVHASSGQDVRPYDRTQPYSRLGLDGRFVDMFDGELYQWSFYGNISLFDSRHQAGMEIPFMRTDYITNVERRTGIGDVKLHYLFQAKGSQYSETALAFRLDYHIPTGDRNSGHGVGVSVLSPALVMRWTPVDELTTIVGVRYAHSLGEAESEWGNPPLSSGADGTLEPRIRDLILDAGVVFEFGQNAWLLTNVNYSAYLDESDGTLNLEPEIGKIWNQKWSLAAKSRLYIGGRKRVESIIGFDCGYYFPI